LNRFFLAFRCWYSILAHGQLPAESLSELGVSQPAAIAEPAPAEPGITPPTSTSDGALQMLSILQRDARLLDFLMEDISGYADDQVGAAVRQLHEQCRDAVSRYVTLQPVIDGVEGTFTHTPSKDPNMVKFVGNVPAEPPEAGILRHKGWRASRVDLPAISAAQDTAIVAPAELEVE
jgi:hypothetical protein